MYAGALQEVILVESRSPGKVTGNLIEKKKPVSISKSAGPRHCFNVNCTGHGIKIFRFMDKGTSRAEFKDHFKTRGILFPTSDA